MQQECVWDFGFSGGLIFQRYLGGMRLVITHFSNHLWGQKPIEGLMRLVLLENLVPVFNGAGDNYSLQYFECHVARGITGGNLSFHADKMRQRGDGEDSSPVVIK